jgi:alginate O-acetyltransferase complex protein AlgI
MPLHSPQVFAFVAIVLSLYYLLPRRQNLTLLLASYIFCLFFSWPFLLLLWAVSGANYILGIKTGAGSSSRAWLRLGILLNLLVFCSFKFAHLFLPGETGAGSSLSAAWQDGGARLLMPIGLSFYVLQAISYLLDVHRGQVAPSRDVAAFALYMACFPKFTAGPIERYRAFAPQVRRPRRLDGERLSRGVALVVTGLLRKVVIADTLLQAVPLVFFQKPQKLLGLELVTWLVIFILGLYNDFCGYTDMARGIGSLFGIELSPNFNAPFFSRNFSEVWGRWHMTLSHWIRDYVYFPAGRALARRFPRPAHPLNILVPPLLAMLASGLWHAPTLGFILWGTLMGLLLAGERALSLALPKSRPRKDHFWIHAAKSLTVSCLWSSALVFALMDLPQALAFFARVFSRMGSTLPDTRVLLMALPSFWLDALQVRRRGEPPFLSGLPWKRAMLLGAALLAVLLFAQSRPAIPFVYQDF